MDRDPAALQKGRAQPGFDGDARPDQGAFASHAGQDLRPDYGRLASSDTGWRHRIGLRQGRLPITSVMIADHGLCAVVLSLRFAGYLDALKHSERAKFSDAVNARTERESSERSLISLAD